MENIAARNPGWSKSAFEASRKEGAAGSGWGAGSESEELTPEQLDLVERAEDGDMDAVAELQELGIIDK